MELVRDTGIEPRWRCVHELTGSRRLVDGLPCRDLTARPPRGYRAGFALRPRVSASASSVAKVSKAVQQSTFGAGAVDPGLPEGAQCAVLQGAAGDALAVAAD